MLTSHVRHTTTTTTYTINSSNHQVLMAMMMHHSMPAKSVTGGSSSSSTSRGSTGYRSLCCGRSGCMQEASRCVDVCVCALIHNNIKQLCTCLCQEIELVPCSKSY